MKKIILIAFAFSLLSTSAFAVTTFTSAGGVGTGVLAGFKASKQVNVICSSSGQLYAATAEHSNGTRIFAVASGDPLIYFKTKAVSNGFETTNITTSLSSQFVGATGWASL